MTGTSLLGGRGLGTQRSDPYQLRVYGGRTAHPLSAMYHDDVSGRPLGLPGSSSLTGQSAHYRTWVNPEVVIRSSHADGESRIDEDSIFDSIGPQVHNEESLDTLASQYIKSRREVYMKRGWSYFREAEYRQAYDSFNLADSVSVDERSARSEVKIALLYSAMASNRYSLATAILEWLLDIDARSGQLRDPSFLLRVPTLDKMYESNLMEQDYRAHLEEIEDYHARNPDAPAAAALRAMMYWLDNEDQHRDDAIRLAKLAAEASEKTSSWSRLHPLMEQSILLESMKRNREVPLPEPPMLPGDGEPDAERNVLPPEILSDL